MKISFTFKELSFVLKSFSRGNTISELEIRTIARFVRNLFYFAETTDNSNPNLVLLHAYDSFCLGVIDENTDMDAYHCIIDIVNTFDTNSEFFFEELEWLRELDLCREFLPF
ncbi:MAG: hypothetical protein ACLS95_06565 [Clostridia bacterium]